MKITSIRNTQVNLVIIWYIIGYHSGKVLNIGVRNTFCIICARAIYNETKPDHICFKNWFRSANAMVADIIVERFRQSLSLYGVRYMRVIGDGDNSVIEKLRNMRPYGIDFVIEKIECANHICRNFNKSLNYTVHDVKWIPCSAKFVSIGGKSNGAGVIETFSISGDGIEKLGEFGKKDHFKCGTFNASSLRDRHLATGDFSGRLQVWDLEDNLVPVYKAEKHKGVINAIDGVAGATNGCGAPEIVTGSKDGSVMVWDVRQKDTPVAKFCPNEGLQGRDCWAVAFGNSYNNEERVVAAGYDNGDIKMYDLKNMSIRWSKCVKNGVVSLQFDRKDIEMNKLVATTLESKIFCFDVRTQHPKKGFAQVVEKAHNSTIWTVKHLPQNREIFMTTGGTGSLCLWKYNYPEKRVDKDSDGLNYGIPGELTLIQNSTLSDQPITSFDWCPDKTGLSVCSAFDQTVRVLITTKLNLY